jgi:stage II sporulation protein AA (anti-sigma F factor antagonist)
MTDINITIEDIALGAADKTAKQISFKGQLDETNVDEKAKLIYAIIEKTPQNLHLVMDFANLEYMNSKSIGYLTDWYGKVSEGGGKIAIAGARPNILDILEVVGLTQLINCYPSVDEAKVALFPGEEAKTIRPANDNGSDSQMKKAA